MFIFEENMKLALKVEGYLMTDNWARLPDPLRGGHRQWFPGLHRHGVNQVFKEENEKY